MRPEDLLRTTAGKQYHDPENRWNERPAFPNLPRAEYVSPCAGKQYFACSVLPMS